MEITMDWLDNNWPTKVNVETLTKVLTGQCLVGAHTNRMGG